MMDYYVQPLHLYSHSRTCTCSGLCRRLSRLVAFLIWYLLDHASVHKISTLVTWFQCMSDIFIFHGDHDPLYIFTMEILIYLYCTWWWPHMLYFVSCLFMAIVLLCIWDCYMYLQLWAEFDYCIILLDGWFFHLVLQCLNGLMDSMDWFSIENPSFQLLFTMFFQQVAFVFSLHFYMLS